MKQILDYIGIILIVVGVVLFAVDYFFKCNSNLLLLSALGCVLLGVVGQIWSMKRAGEQ
ncbi:MULTISPECIES: hypothetical protein [Prevotella]|jgi:hypothetical protein|uniref:hypothetical protein n=1 Tax=Prevotella lacticifex TaxID=2854755 RepID=UPI001CC4A304|nr:MULTISPECIES: hypothetical protein [Prevotella]MDD6853439.1 hypothetical protein [Prevotella sp.]